MLVVPPPLTLADALAREIARRNITQAEAARLLGVHSARVSRWVLGDEPAPDAYDALVTFLRLPGWPALGELIMRGKAERAAKLRRRA